MSDDEHENLKAKLLKAARAGLPALREAELLLTTEPETEPETLKKRVWRAQIAEVITKLEKPDDEVDLVAVAETLLKLARTPGTTP